MELENGLVKRFYINRKEFIDKLFRKSNEAGNIVYKNFKGKNLLKRIKEAELQRVETFFQILDTFLFNILNSFPRFEELPTFYQKLLDALIGKKDFKLTLGKINKLRTILREEKRKTRERIKNAKNKELVIKTRKAFFGRTMSFLDEINFNKLNEWVEVLYSFPLIDKKSLKVVILGMPNVGKSTLLSKLTPSKPKIADYEFTTLIINRGEMKKGIEVLDTPGLLDRDFEKLNKIEKEALIAFSELANVCLFIFDPTKNLKEQFNVFKRFYENGKDKIWLFYLSKEDLTSKEQSAQFKEKLIKSLKGCGLKDIEIYSLTNLERLKRKIENIYYQNL
jgi:nucleolar GTP-binding protein